MTVIQPVPSSVGCRSLNIAQCNSHPAILVQYNIMVTAAQPFVAVIAACLDEEKAIARTIESVLNQTYNPVEYIVIDRAQ